MSHSLGTLMTRGRGERLPRSRPTSRTCRFGDRPGAITRSRPRWWRDLAVMPPHRYDALSGKVGRRFVNVLVRELRGVLDRWWNSEHFIVFQTVTLHRAHHVTASRDILRRIEKRLDAWEAGSHKMLVEDTLRSSTQYLTAVRREESAEHRAKTFHGFTLLT